MAVLPKIFCAWTDFSPFFPQITHGGKVEARQALLQKILPLPAVKYWRHFRWHREHSGQVVWKQCWEQKFFPLADKYLPRIFFLHTLQSNAVSRAGRAAKNRMKKKHFFTIPAFRCFVLWQYKNTLLFENYHNIFYFWLCTKQWLIFLYSNLFAMHLVSARLGSACWTHAEPQGPGKNRKLIACWFFIGAGGRGLSFKGFSPLKIPARGGCPLTRRLTIQIVCAP